MDDYYAPSEDEPQPQQSQPPEGFIPYRPQAAAEPPEGFVPYRPQATAGPPEGFIPHRPQAAQQEPAPPIKSAPPTATDEERRVIYGDEPLGTPSATGGLSPTAGSTVTSTTPVQDIPAPKVNKAGETLPTYILREMGTGLLGLPQRVTQAAGELQRQGDVYRPDPAIEAALMTYGARSLAGGFKFRPIPGAEAARPGATAGPRITPEGQYQLPLEGTHQPESPGAVEPVGPSQGELPLEAPVSDPLKRQGQTPGPTSAPGVAQEPNPPATVPVADAQNKTTLGTGELEKGGENLNTRNYGKKTPVATGEASGVNVLPDGVDPTVASTFKAEAPPVEPPAAAPAPEVPPVRPAPALEPIPVDRQPTRSAGDLHIERNPDGGHVLMRGDNVISQHPNVGQAMIAMNRMAREERVPVPAGTVELPPVEVRPGEAPKFSLKKDDVATAVREEKHGGERPVYSINNASGEKIGEVRLSRPFEHQLVIDDIKATGGSYSGSLRKGMPLGPDVLKSFLQQIPKEFPEVTMVGGSRVSGARGVAGTDQRVFRKLSDLLADERGGGRLPTAESIAEAARAVGKSVAEFIKDERGGWRTKPPRTPAEERVLSRLAPEPGLLDDVPRTRAEAASQWRKFYAGFKNAADAFEQLKHRSLDPVAPEVDPGVLARLIKGLGGRINQVLEDGTYSVRTRQITGDPLRTVMDKIAHDPAGFDAYAMSRTTIERAGHGAKTGIALPDAHQIVAQSGAKWGPILTELNAWKGRMLDTAVDILGPQAVNAMKTKYPGHIALHRMLEPDSPTAGLLGGGMQARNPLHRLLKGNEDLKILNVRDSTIRDGIALLDMAERNRVGMAMEDLNNKLGPNSKFMREVQDVHPIDISAAEVNRHLGVEGITEQVADGFKVFRKDAFHPAPNRIRVFRDGKAKVYEVDPELGKAFHSLEHHSFGLLTKILSVPAKMLRAGSVLIPEFIIKNLFRDQIAAFTQAKGFIPGVDTAMGMKNLFPGKSSEAFQRWQIEGGANASLVSMDRKIFHQDPRNLLQHVGNVVTSPYHFLQMMSEVAENATRLGVYERSIKGGAHPIEATYAAREGTLDFQRIGGWAIQKALNQIIPFYNVALEGTDRTLRALFTGDRKLVTSMKMVGGITVPSLYIWAATKDDERVQQVPRWQKDIAWIIPGRDDWKPISTQGRNEILDGMVQRMPGLDTSKLTHTFRQAPDGSWEYNNGWLWRLPKPPGVGQLFGSIPERMLDAYVKQDPTAYKELGKTMWQAFAPSILPQAALPEIERWANRSTFLDRTLISPTLQKLPTSQQYEPHTSEVAKLVAKGIRSIAGDKTSLGAPIMVDNYIHAWSGGMGKYITDMIDLGLRDKDAPVKPAWSGADIPVLKGIVARFPSGSAQAIQQFYDTYDERKQAAAGIKNLQKKGLPEDPSLLRENPIQGIHNALGVGFKTVRNIAADKNMSAEDKRTAMDLTYLFMIEKAKQGLKALDESKRKATPPPGFIPYQPGAQ